jgi:diguanylate cyclase (GGDEF)-like protein
LRRGELTAVHILSWALLCATGVAADDGLAAISHTARVTIAPATPGRLPWVVFDERSGLPQHTIVDMLADQRGFVWAATQDGLARYDGRSWVAIPLPRRMSSNYPRTIRSAKDGGLWIGSFDGGLAHLRDGHWTLIGAAEGLPSNRIRGLLETTDAGGQTVLWIATDHGVARRVGGRLEVFGEGSGLPSLDAEGLCETTLVTGERALVVGTVNGMARFTGDRFVPVPVPRQILGHRIGDIAQSTGLGGREALWITSYGAGMAVLEGGEWTVLDTSSGLPSNVEVITKSAAEDGSPALWIGTEGGLLRFEHGRFTIYDERSGLPIRIIWKVLETTAPSGLKTIWLGTWGGGVVRLSPNAWRGFDATSGVPSGSVTSVLVTDDGGKETVWAGTSDGGLARFDGDRFHAIPLPAPMRHAIVFSLRETKDPDGQRSVWVGSFGGGVGRLKNGRWSLLDPRLLPNKRVYDIFETKADDGSSVLWLGTENGLARVENGRSTFFRSGAELPSEIVSEILETRRPDGRRTTWVATSRGISRLEDGRWSVLARESGLASANVTSLAAATDASGTQWLWAGTFAGAARLRLDPPGARWETFNSSTSPALPSDTVQGVAQDHERRIYVFTTRGVARLTPRAPTAEDPSVFASELFTIEDGLPSSDCQQLARFVDHHGRVWAGTARGLGMLDPRQERPDHAPKPLVIDTAALSDGTRTLLAGESLPYRERNLTFTAVLLAFGGESRIRYRYQLAGFDPMPSDWVVSGTKEYTNLGAGDYVFQAWGRDARGNLSGPVDFPFQVRPAPWMTGWAFAAYAVAIALAVHGAIQWRVRALARRTLELESVVSERTRDLVAARDQLEQLASVDALTGVANRRIFDATLEREWKRAQRGGHWVSLALLDVDYFKRFNDRYGHGAGDVCLRAVAQAVAAQCRRPTDLAARYGGEEFALVLPETDPEGVRRMLGAVLAAVDGLAIPHADSGCAAHVTISLGAVSVRPAADADAASALEHADRLLYLAKEGGRHQARHEDGSGPGRPVIEAAAG